MSPSECHHRHLKLKGSTNPTLANEVHEPWFLCLSFVETNCHRTMLSSHTPNGRKHGNSTMLDFHCTKVLEVFPGPEHPRQGRWLVTSLKP